MTIHEAYLKGHTKLRRPHWNKKSYIEIDGDKIGNVYPWVNLYDHAAPDGAEFENPTKLPITEFPFDDFEPHEE